jgi:hypothetical protein
MDNKLKTDWRIKKEAQDLAIYEERQAMRRNGSMATAVDDALCKKYDIAARSTIWFTCQRVEKRLKNAQL